MMYLFLVLELVVLALVAYTGYNIQLVVDGVIWGIRVSPSKTQKSFKIRNMVGFVIGMIALFIMIVPVFREVCNLFIRNTMMNPIMGIVSVALYGLIWFLVFFIAAKIAEKSSKKKLYSGRETNTYVLSELPFVKSVEAQMNDAEYFIVSFEGIALANKMNYCYAIERYENYQMGALSSPKEVALIGMYFVQKYHDSFKFKVDMETIPGAPGQTVVAFGTGGVGVAHVKGTRDKKIFRSYIFTRK